MARRPTAGRSARTQEPDVDDAYAWESPKKRKKKATGKVSRKSTSSTSARSGGSARSSKSAKSTKTTKSAKATGKSAKAKTTDAPKSKSASGKGTGKRKAAGGSARKSSAGSDRLGASGKRTSKRSSASTSGERMNGSGRRRAAPPPRKKQDQTVLVISVVTIPLLLLIGAILFSKVSTPAPARDDQSALDAALKLADEGEQAFRAWNRAKASNDVAEEKRQHQLALSKLQKAMEDMSKVLSQPPYVGPDEMLKPEYEGYEARMSEISQLMIDLEKGGTLH